MQVLARAAVGVALLAGVAAMQPARTSAQGGGAAGLAAFCQELVEDEALFATTGECVSTHVTLSNRGEAEGVGVCKFLFALLGIPQQYFGQCVRELQGGGGGLPE